MAKVKFKARVLRQGRSIARNQDSKYYAVCFAIQGVQGMRGKDHILVFPSDWASKALADKVAAGAVKDGGYYLLEGDVYEYVRKDGSRSSAIRNLAPAK